MILNGEKSENKFAILRANRKKEELTMSVCFNTSTSFEPLCVTFLYVFLFLCKASLILYSVHGIYMCVRSDTNAMFIFVSDRSLLVAQLERYGIHNVCKYNNGTIGVKLVVGRRCHER